VLEEHPAVRGALAFGVPDDELGQRVEAVADVAGAGVGGEELRAFAAARLDAARRPARVRVTDEPVRDDAGKARRGRWAGAAGRPGSGAGTGYRVPGAEGPAGRVTADPAADAELLLVARPGPGTVVGDHPRDLLTDRPASPAATPRATRTWPGRRRLRECSKNRRRD
jgi:hypothetical protein